MDLNTYKKPFLLNDAFKDFNHEDLSKTNFYIIFFGLLTSSLIRIEKMPKEMVAGNSYITYTLSQLGNSVVQKFEADNQAFSAGNQETPEDDV